MVMKPVFQKRMSRILAFFAVLLLLAEVLLTLLSWVVAVLSEGSGWRSVVSSGGIRHIWGRFSSFAASEWLVWLLLGSVALGAVYKSGLVETIAQCRRFYSLSYRNRLALCVVGAEFLAAVGTLLLLTATSSAPLLSVLGTLGDGVFPLGIVPFVACWLIVFGISFALCTQRCKSAASVLGLLSFGIRASGDVVVLYFLASLFVFTLGYVFLW